MKSIPVEGTKIDANSFYIILYNSLDETVRCEFLCVSLFLRYENVDYTLFWS